MYGPTAARGADAPAREVSYQLRCICYESGAVCRTECAQYWVVTCTWCYARLHVLERAQRWKEAYHYAIFHGHVAKSLAYMVRLSAASSAMPSPVLT